MSRKPNTSNGGNGSVSLTRKHASQTAKNKFKSSNRTKAGRIKPLKKVQSDVVCFVSLPDENGLITLCFKKSKNFKGNIIQPPAFCDDRSAGKLSYEELVRRACMKNFKLCDTSSMEIIFQERFIDRNKEFNVIYVDKLNLQTAAFEAEKCIFDAVVKSKGHMHIPGKGKCQVTNITIKVCKKAKELYNEKKARIEQEEKLRNQLRVVSKNVDQQIAIAIG